METKNINYQRIEEAIHYLEANFRKQPELDEIAEQVHLSPFHFQRIFTEWAGISPKKFLQFLTIDFLKKKITQTRSLNEAAEAAGLSAQSRVYDLFVNLEAMTPQEYKEQGNGIDIFYGFHETLFGSALIGVTSRGICWLSFHSDESNESELESLKANWFKSRLIKDFQLTEKYITSIFGERADGKQTLLLKGTNFQIKVWEAILRIPTGGVATYQDIASRISKPKALQAVGSAVGANHVAYLIPCHRVIRKDGVLGEYRWGPTRKKSLIGWEMAKTA